ncbi:TatD family hydrolase [Desulfolucanica intricata]|uniref:TatD family hydrolase n=1 Tax=Desulfolucanica intricata TaxID=1285191 RepID=UPI000831C82D|nr:TatD family hydrolase [Desulfolucanica intricata]
MLIDTHAHLDDKKFDEDREDVISRAGAAGVALIINAACDINSSEKAITLAQNYAQIYAAVGIHPHDAKDAGKDYLQKLIELSRNEKVVAIGEIGLDYYYDFSPRPVQQKIFREQLSLAKELNLPVIIHNRDAHKDVLEILHEEGLGPAGGVMHCFSGSWEVARECLNLGMYISFAGPVTFQNAKKLKEVAAKVPVDKILAETDCPYLTPHPHRGKRNEPANVRFVVQQIAELKGLNPDDMENIILKNAKKLFSL